MYENNLSFPQVGLLLTFLKEVSAKVDNWQANTCSAAYKIVTIVMNLYYNLKPSIPYINTETILIICLTQQTLKEILISFVERKKGM